MSLNTCLPALESVSLMDKSPKWSSMLTRTGMVVLTSRSSARSSRNYDYAMSLYVWGMEWRAEFESYNSIHVKYKPVRVVQGGTGHWWPRQSRQHHPQTSNCCHLNACGSHSRSTTSFFGRFVQEGGRLGCVRHHGRVCLPRVPFASLSPLLGTQHALILPYLEALCAHDETVVRERAVTSITRLLDLYSDNDINNFIIPLVLLITLRLFALLPMRLTSPAVSQPLSLCATSTQGLDLTRKKSESIISPTQQVFRHLQWGNASAAKSDSHQNTSNVQDLLKRVCALRSHWYPQAPLYRLARSNPGASHWELQGGLKDSHSRLE